MKKLNYVIFSLVILSIAAITSGHSPSTGVRYTPVFMERSELERSVRLVDSPREIVDPGKIYMKGDYIFVNERYKGVHIIDNSDPYNPKQVSYLIVPGCIDIAVSGNIIYVDNAVDLVAFDLEGRRETARIKDYFPEPGAPDGNYHYTGERPRGLILVGWKTVSNY